MLNDDILGSMEFACKASGAKLIAVIGHSNCGAIKGAIDDVELGSLTGLLARIKPAMDAVPADVQPRTTKNSAFVDEVSEANGIRGQRAAGDEGNSRAQSDLERDD